MNGHAMVIMFAIAMTMLLVSPMMVKQGPAYSTQRFYGSPRKPHYKLWKAHGLW